MRCVTQSADWVCRGRSSVRPPWRTYSAANRIRGWRRRRSTSPTGGRRYGAALQAADSVTHSNACGARHTRRIAFAAEKVAPAPRGVPQVNDWATINSQPWIGTGNSFFGNFGVFITFAGDLTEMAFSALLESALATSPCAAHFHHAATTSRRSRRYAARHADSGAWTRIPVAARPARKRCLAARRPHGVGVSFCWRTFQKIVANADLSGL